MKSSMAINVYVGWTAILLTLVVVAAINLLFHRDEWLGGYSS